MSKKRPGVEAAMRLADCFDVALWESVDSQLPQVVASIDNLGNLTNSCKNLGTKQSISKGGLLDVVKWKFAVGKPRYALMKLLESNSEESVKKCSKAAISEARMIPSTNNSDTNIKIALEHLTNLKGVGPATSSAVLSLFRPEKFCYMYDEVIDSFLPKRTYTLPVYMKVNEECTSIANKLGGGWTTSAVARTLWVAARVCASGGEDYTLKQGSGKRALDEHMGTIEKPIRTKRRRK